jgi:hypothetical protein
VSRLPVEVVRLVTARADGRCEYCRMHQALQGATFHVEHIVPTAAGGSDDASNLCLACPPCNLHKSDRTHGVDPDTERPAPLFDPRRDLWDDHFAWVGRRLAGRTPAGRATVALLDLNSPRRLLIREAEETFDLFPPDD